MTDTASGNPNTQPSMRRVAIDVMGGDHGPGVTVPAALDALARDPSMELLLVGRKDLIHRELENQPIEPAGHVRVIDAQEVISSDATPRDALRKSQSSSLGRALALVADKEADACVSAGNTVALMTLAVKLVGVLEGIRRPALMSHIPTPSGLTGLLDLGANLNVSADQLFQFAVMGAVVKQNTDTTGHPSVGLLNVGHEDSKGHTVVREAHERLLKSTLNYAGFIEGHDLFHGKVDVAVCDGFAGNLILKSSEGLAAMLFAELRNTLSSGPREKLGAMLVKPALRDMLARLNPAKHNGAPLLGLSRVVVKSHGRSDREATMYAILEAGREVRRNVPERIEADIRSHHAEDSP